VVDGKPRIVVLRLGSRPFRDQRVNTHCALVARAFMADGIVFGFYDSKLRRTIMEVVEKFGGEFFVESRKDWMGFIQDWLKGGGEVVHLTCYGLRLPDAIEKIRSSIKDKLIIIGGPKVPSEIYQLATYNISVTSQPHSEIAALAVFLDHIHQGQEFHKLLPGGKYRILPSARGKKVVKAEE
jgi:tRNA (cytidine56-2'-O)-methyltransferase